MRRRLGVGAVMVIAGMGWALLLSSPAAADLPPGYIPVPAVVPLNAAHVGSVGSEFTQECDGLPRPPEPGEVAWHFILPQSVLRDPTPTNIFNTLTVHFDSSGFVTLSAVSDFGPPSSAHAYVYTSTDDTLLNGAATTGRDPTAADDRGNDPDFNLSHTCAAGAPPTTTTTTTTTTSSTTTTTSTAGSSVGATGGTPSALVGGGTPSSVAAVAAAQVSPAGSTGPVLALTGTRVPVGLLAVGFATLIAGIALVVGSRGRASHR